MPAHEVQLPICSDAFKDNTKAHDKLWEKHDETETKLTELRIEKAREMAELQTKVLIYSTIGSAVASGIAMIIVGLIIYVIQTKFIK